MKKIDGIQIGNRVFRYGNNVFQTDGGFLLKFTSGAERWQGMFPGCPWDNFYDEVLMNLSSKHINRLVLKQRYSVPLLIMGSNIGFCTRCNNNTDHKFCSVSCWFFDTIDTEREIISEADTIAKIDRNVAFVEQMVALYGEQVDAELANLSPTQP